MTRGKFNWKVGTVILCFMICGTQPVDMVGAAQRGGSLKVICTGGDVPCLGYAPDLRSFYQMFFTNPVCETLLRWDDKGTPAPHLATGWKFSDDLKSITLFLRKGVKFHDGTDFDAEAVKANFEAYQKSGRTELSMISSFDVLDKHTLRLNLTSFNNMLLTQFTMNVGVMASPAAFKKAGVNEFCRNPVGTGPFKFKSWQRDLSVKFERFQEYWQPGKPYLDSFEWVHIKDPMTAMSAFMAGEADVVLTVPYSQAAELKRGGQYEIKTVQNVSGSFGGDSGNPNSPFSKLKVRQAVSHAFDGNAISEAIFHGFADVTNQYSSPKSWGYNKAVTGYSYDPQKAKKLLSEAGYPNGFRTTLWSLNIDVRPQMATAVQAYLKEVGIEAEVKLLESSAWMDKVRTGWEGLMYLSVGNAIPDDLRGAYMFSNRKATLWKSIEYNKELEDLVDKAMATPDFKTKAALVQEYNRLLVDKYCLIHPTVIVPNACAVKKYVRNSGLFETSWLQFNPADIYLSK